MRGVREQKQVAVIANSFSLLALIGFGASLITHLAGYVGIDRPFGINPWPLHVGVFIVLIPTVIAARHLTKDFLRKDMWKAALRGCPNWMRYLLFAIFGYAILSFFGFIFFSFDSGDNEASTIRGFSGHWLIFYFAAYAILHSYSNVSKNDTIRRCQNMHPAEPAEKYCSECGAHVGKEI